VCPAHGARPRAEGGQLGLDGGQRDAAAGEHGLQRADHLARRGEVVRSGAQPGAAPRRSGAAELVALRVLEDLVRARRVVERADRHPRQHARQPGDIGPQPARIRQHLADRAPRPQVVLDAMQAGEARVSRAARKPARRAVDGDVEIA
jgi:hypothetical protein